MKQTRIQVSTLKKGFSLLKKSFRLPNRQTLFYWTTKKVQVHKKVILRNNQAPTKAQTLESKMLQLEWKEKKTLQVCLSLLQVMTISKCKDYSTKYTVL